MTTLAKLLVALGVDAKDFQAGLADAESTTTRFVSKITDGLSVVTNAADAAVIGGTKALVGGFLDLGRSGLSLNNSLEQTSARINAFTKDGAKTAEILAMIQSRAAKTPFEFDEMASAAAALIPTSKQAGTGLETLIEKAEILAASNPAEGLEGAAFALKEAVSGDFTSIIERFNLPRSYINKLKEEGVPALEIVQRAMTELGYDTDLVSNLANTAEGRWSTFKDTIQSLAAKVTQPIFNQLSGGLAVVNDWLTKNEPMITAFADSLANGLGTAIQGVISNVQLFIETWGVAGEFTSGFLQQLGATIDLLFGLDGTFETIATTVTTVLGTAFSTASTLTQPLVDAFTKFGPLSSEFGSAIATISPGLAIVQGAIAAAVPIVQQLIDIFLNAATIASDSSTTITTVWQTVQTAISAIVPAILAVIKAVFGELLIFLTNNGDEISSFLATTWNTVLEIITLAVQVITEIAVAAFGAIAAFITAHSAEIQFILQSAWTTITSIITAALTLIKGILTAVMQAIHGDWSGAWNTIQQTCASVVLSLRDAIVGFLNFIAGFFGTSLQGIVDLWSHNWDTLVQIIGSIPSRVAGVGAAIIETIKNGFLGAWNGFISIVSGKLQDLRNMLPFSEPKDHRSPLYGLTHSGAAIVGELQKGINMAPALTLPARVASPIRDFGGSAVRTPQVNTPRTDGGNKGNVINAWIDAKGATKGTEDNIKKGISELLGKASSDADVRIRNGAVDFGGSFSKG